MNYQLNHDALKNDARFTILARELEPLGPLQDAASFNRYCRAACRLWDELNIAATPTPRFDELLARIEAGGDDIIATAWGGVVITRHEPPFVEKFLVVKRGGYLALEKHELKDEHLEVREGAGLFLWRDEPNQALRVEAIAPGARFHLAPGREHCLIGAQNLLVFESSSDPKGMDQDLIFIFEPDENGA